MAGNELIDLFRQGAKRYHLIATVENGVVAGLDLGYIEVQRRKQNQRDKRRTSSTSVIPPSTRIFYAVSIES